MYGSSSETLNKPQLRTEFCCLSSYTHSCNWTTSNPSFRTSTGLIITYKTLHLLAPPTCLSSSTGTLPTTLSGQLTQTRAFCIACPLSGTHSQKTWESPPSLSTFKKSLTHSALIVLLFFVPIVLGYSICVMSLFFCCFLSSNRVFRKVQCRYKVSLLSS